MRKLKLRWVDNKDESTCNSGRNETATTHSWRLMYGLCAVTTVWMRRTTSKLTDAVTVYSFSPFGNTTLNFSTLDEIKSVAVQQRIARLKTTIEAHQLEIDALLKMKR